MSQPGSTQRTPRGIIIIPIGLIISLLWVGLRMLLAGAVQKNAYPESDVNTLDSGLSFYDQGDYENAITQFNRAIASQPKMGEAYNDRGLAYFSLGETGQAMADFNKAIELLPNPAVAYNNRGALYLSQGDHEQALTDLDKAIELSSTLAKAYQNRALTYLDLDNYDQAIADFDEAIDLTPEFMFYVQATMESGASPAEKSLLDSGFLTGQMNRQTYADLPTAYASRAIAYLRKGDFKRAAADLEKATQLGLNPGFAEQVKALLPVSMLTPQAGHWEGSSNHGGYQGAVSFDIGADGRVRDFELALVFGPANACLVALDEVWLQPDGTFLAVFGTTDSASGNLIKGGFESPTVVDGTFSRHVECVSTTGEQINGELSAGASWGAIWISGPEATPTENSSFGQPTDAATSSEPASTEVAIEPAATAVSNESEGPNVTALALDPKMPYTVYVAASGWIYKSTDGGDHWLGASAGLPGSRVNVLAIDPRTPTTLYAGTSTGLYKSTDGGESWNGIYREAVQTEILTLVLDPGTPATIYAGTPAGVQKSADGGTTWLPLISELAMSPVNVLAIDPLTPTTLYAGTPNGVFKTTDGGGTWSAVNNGLPQSGVQTLAVDPVTPATLYAGTGEGLFKSSDGGQSWNRSYGPSPIVAFALDSRRPSTIFIATPDDGMFTSADSGANWTAIQGIQVKVYVNVLVVDLATAEVLYVGSSDGLDMITNGGWISIDIGWPN